MMDTSIDDLSDHPEGLMTQAAGGPTSLSWLAGRHRFRTSRFLTEGTRIRMHFAKFSTLKVQHGAHLISDSPRGLLASFRLGNDYIRKRSSPPYLLGRVFSLVFCV